MNEFTKVLGNNKFRQLKDVIKGINMWGKSSSKEGYYASILLIERTLKGLYELMENIKERIIILATLVLTFSAIRLQSFLPKITSVC